MGDVLGFSFTDVIINSSLESANQTFLLLSPYLHSSTAYWNAFLFSSSSKTPSSIDAGFSCKAGFPIYGLRSSSLSLDDD